MDLGGGPAVASYVYGVMDGRIVVMRRVVAERFADVWRASKQVCTWGEFRSHLDAEALAELQEHFEYAREEGSPPDEEPFASIQESVDGWGDGDWFWPGWPEALMLGDLPEAVQARVGRGTTSMLSGDSYYIEAVEEAELVAAFRDLGLVLVRDDRLVGEACGY